ncbi:MAG: WD40 repeat domain-containing protein [Gammaproteobacteria bacterium]
MTADPPDHVLTGIHEFGSTALAYTHDGQQLISGGYRGDIRVWDARTHQPRVAMHGHRKPVRALLPLPSGHFVSGGDDGRLILWRQGVIQAQHEGAGVTALALFQGRVISGHNDGRLRIWSTDALRAQGEIPMPEDVVALSVQDAQLAVGLDDRIVVLGPDLRPIKTLPSPHTPHDLQFSPDGRLLAAGNWFRLSVWDMASGKHRTIPTEHNGLLTSVAFSPDGRLLATLGRHTDSAIRLFDTHDFKVVKRYQAHDLCGALIRFSPDGRTLATASDDESVRLHRLEKKRYSSSGAIPPAH